MFETSSVTNDQRKFHPLTFTISAILHVAAIAVVTFVTVWDVEIPSKAPDQIVGFQVAAGPPPPMISRGRPDVPKQPVTEPPREQQPVLDHTPIEIPDLTVPLDTQVGPVTGGVGDEPGERFGDPDGSDTGDPDGDILGTEDGTGTAATPPSQPYDIANGVRPPTIVHRVEPLYPPLLQRIGKRGVVQIECIISQNGSLTDIRVIHASHPLFADAALAAVKQWRFLPGSFEGRAVATRFNFRVNFEVQR